MKTFFIGVDVSKDWLDFAVCESLTFEILKTFRCNNTLDGIEKAINICQKTSSNHKLWFCFEHTGHYGLLLSHLLERNSIIYSAVPALEIIKSIGITRGKSDVIDAIRIAQYAAVNTHKIKESKLPGEAILKIKNLLTYRQQLVKISTQFKNSLKTFLVANKSMNVTEIIDDLTAKIEVLKKDILKIENDIENEINSSNSLKETFQKIKTVKGVGFMIAVSMIVYTNNFTCFDEARKFNSYAGIAPFSHSSGSSIRGKTKTSTLRNKNMKKLLFNGANSAVMCDFEMRNYFLRKKEEGKHHLTIINAVACKLVYRIFAVVKRNEPYVNLVR